MSYIVARMQKMKAENLGGAYKHNERIFKNHSNEDIDVSRSHLNYELLNMLARINRDVGTLQNVGKLDDLLASLSADEQGVRFLESPLAMYQVKILLQEEYGIHLAYQQDRELEVAFGIETDEQMYVSIGKFLDDLLDMEKRYLILHKIIKSIKNMTLTEKLEYYQDEANRRK